MSPSLGKEGMDCHSKEMGRRTMLGHRDRHGLNLWERRKAFHVDWPKLHSNHRSITLSTQKQMIVDVVSLPALPLCGLSSHPFLLGNHSLTLNVCGLRGIHTFPPVPGMTN